MIFVFCWTIIVVDNFFFFFHLVHLLRSNKQFKCYQLIIFQLFFSLSLLSHFMAKFFFVLFSGNCYSTATHQKPAFQIYFEMIMDAKTKTNNLMSLATFFLILFLQEFIKQKKIVYCCVSCQLMLCVSIGYTRCIHKNLTIILLTKKENAEHKRVCV